MKPPQKEKEFKKESLNKGFKQRVQTKGSKKPSQKKREFKKRVQKKREFKQRV